MEITLLVKSFMGLVTLLVFLIFCLLHSPKKKKKKVKEKLSTAKEIGSTNYKSLNDLLQIIKNKQSTQDELATALDLVIKYHGRIHPKMGIRIHPEFDTYGEMLLRICRHPNINKTILLKFNRDLERRNDAYKREINDFVTKGLNSRGF